MILGAVGAFAALAVLVVERTVTDEVEVPTDPTARLISADVDAAFVAAEAVRTAIRLAETPDRDDDYDRAELVPRPPNCDRPLLHHCNFRESCEQIADSYSDVLDGAEWEWDWDWDATASDALVSSPDGPAKCRLVPLDLRAGAT